VFELVWRRDFCRPGVALIGLPAGVDSCALRLFMVTLKRALAERVQRVTGRHLVYLSMGRFDQQVTTKFHIDGAPDESFLMLGYEPSEVGSTLAIADYTRAAHERGITPRTLVTDFNPMYAAGEKMLQGHIRHLTEFDPALPHVLLLNNSCLPWREDQSNFLGVMHQATIPEPRTDKSRVVNSTMLTLAAGIAAEVISLAEQEAFLRTDRISGKSY
jgi:hypothetical protein